MKIELINKIADKAREYKISHKDNSSHYNIPEERWIEVGNKLYINSIEYPLEDEKDVLFVGLHNSKKKIVMNMSADVLDDNIGYQLNNIINIAN